MEHAANKLIGIELVSYSTARNPQRVAVGDVIRCPAFQYGFQYSEADSILVGWKNLAFPENLAKTGKGELMHDESRGVCPFLVVAVNLVAGEGPEDLYPGNKRLSLELCCKRLTERFELEMHPEIIRFSQYEPMSVAQPDENGITILGCAELPISWTDSA